MTVEDRDGQGDRPGRAAPDVRRPGLVGRRQAALRRRRVRRVIYRFDHADGLLSNGEADRFPQPIPGEGGAAQEPRLPAGLALSRDGKTLWVAAAFGHSLARFDASSGSSKGEIALGPTTYPYGLAWDEARGRLYVSLWSKAEVAVVDTATSKVVGHWTTEEHPNEMLLAHGGKILYVANANRNTVTVFDTEAGKAIETIGTAIDPKAPPGSTPSSLALSPDESMLFVANANTNNLAVVNVKEPGGSTPLGFIPAGWYPTSVRVARDGKTIYVANGKGASSRANRDGPNPLAPRGATTRPRVHRRPLPGDALDHPDARSAGRWRPTRRRSTSAARCARRPAAVTGPRPAAGNPIPTKVGDPSPIKHVIYIIKENRTYDQVFGDMPAGQRRAEPLPVPRGGHAQPPRAGPRVRAARQLLRRGRGLRRRPRMDRWGPTPPTSSSGSGR